jgi:Fibronectin type III domain
VKQFLLGMFLITTLLACPNNAPITPEPSGPTDTIPPGIPQNLIAEAGDSQIKFSWTANTESDLKGYTLYYGTNASQITTPVVVLKPNISLTLTSLTNDAIYYYQLVAEDTSGNKSGRTITKNATPVFDISKPK